MTTQEREREKAKALRYKKAIVQGLSLETMDYDVMDMEEACYEVQWADETSLLQDIMDEEEARELKIMFSALENDLTRFREDLQECWVPECYEDLMTAVAGASSGVTLLGYDTFEEDYFGIQPGWDTRIAMEEAEKRLMRLKKKELIQAAQQSFNVAFQYVGIRNRYNELQASIDVLRGHTKGMFETIEKINKAHETACSGEAWRNYRRWGFSKEMQRFENIIGEIDPYDRIWIE